MSLPDWFTPAGANLRLARRSDLYRRPHLTTTTTWGTNDEGSHSNDARARARFLIPTNAEATGHRAPMVDACRFQFLDHPLGWTRNEAAAEVQCAFLRFAPGH